MDFFKLKITDTADSLLTLAETKFYEVVVTPPGLLTKPLREGGIHQWRIQGRGSGARAVTGPPYFGKKKKRK